LKNKELNLDFFKDSSSDEEEDHARRKQNEENSGEDSSGPEEVSKAFKFNQDHCLHVFNTLKQGGMNNPANQFD